jgi:hypothetical protein
MKIKQAEIRMVTYEDGIITFPLTMREVEILGCALGILTLSTFGTGIAVIASPNIQSAFADMFNLSQDLANKEDIQTLNVRMVDFMADREVEA